MSESATTLVILGLAVLAFISGRIPTGIVALGVALALAATGILELPQAFAGFADPSVVLIAALFVVAEGLDASGLTAWTGRLLVRRGGGNPVVLTVFVMLVVALLSALITPNGAVAALLPVVVVIARRIEVPPALLLLPLAFGAHAGALLTLTGSPVNVIVSEFAADAAGHGFGFFEFTIVGAPLLVGSILIAALFGRRLIPARSPATMSRDLTEHPSVLLREYPAAASAEVDREAGVAEVLVAPRSGLIGERVFPGMVTDSGELVIVAVSRGGEQLPAGEVVLRAGDVLLLQGSWDALDRNVVDPDVLVVDAPDAVRRQAAPLGWRAGVAIAILAAMVVLLATGLLPPAVTGLLAAIAMVLTGVVPVTRAHRAISWSTILLVAGMIPMSTAITETGTAATIATALVDALGSAGPTVVLLALCVVALIFGQLISNTATVLILAPISVSVATTLGLSPLPFLMGVGVVCAAAFLTPVATPANFMVKDPAGLRFGDYWKLGLPLMALFLAVAVLLVPLVWPF
ncbi:SLC13 family permease [Homoserinibacter sp. GY 40078]|uniref:SLC13 family permease n=1 Tax=Homoserinibacter sp. GY 40078 TaxID=2603275 RepID=UPI0011C9887D|nr:SLC13 family permease [Homoserinibacter sp. GY 40078]TXK18964.1 SLC13 family permease [Homoserinibacter sp. GY 40078]